jgi:15-cis-phytoene synthase
LQIDKTTTYYNDAEPGISGLDPAARWPVWSALIVYRTILSAIAANGFDNISTRAYVSKARKMALLPFAYACASMPSLATSISRSVPF